MSAMKRYLEDNIGEMSNKELLDAGYSYKEIGEMREAFTGKSVKKPTEEQVVKAEVIIATGLFLAGAIVGGLLVYDRAYLKGVSYTSVKIGEDIISGNLNTYMSKTGEKYLVEAHKIAQF